jgi:hypothetical protein
MEHKEQKHRLNVNFTNLVIGFLLGICLLLAIGAATNQDEGPGRYQCCTAGDYSEAVFVLDTQTGQTWRLSRTDSYDFGTPEQRKSIRRSIAPLVN